MRDSRSNVSPRLTDHDAGLPAFVRATVRAAALTAAVLALAWLAGCGGGSDDDEPEQPTPRVDCQREPRACM